jgi:Protein of unknown function (DUF2946)
MLSRSTRRLAAWIAFIAMAMSALAPTVSHALRSITGAGAGSGLPGWVEVCTLAGSKWVKLDAAADPAQQPSAPQASHTIEHCPYCALHAGLPVWPAAEAVRSWAPVAAAPPALGDAPPPSAPPLWRTTPPRGPPRLS